MTKKKTLLSETVIRRWGKLAAMPNLTESWLDEQEDLEDEEAPMEDELAADEADFEGGEEAEAETSPEEEAAVERIVSAVVNAISTETGVDIEVEGEAGEEGAEGEMEAGSMDDIAAAMAGDDAASEDEEPGNRDMMAYNRKDITEMGDKDDKFADKDKDEDDEDEVSEKLNLDVIDDENLTEAVLKRVVERLLRHRRK